ncbi:MAG: YebG family protein [Desulfobacter sp.]
MAVIVKYIVVRNGEEKMTFATKKEADAYDKMLDIADNLFNFLGTSDIEIDEAQQEEISLLMAERRDEVMPILRGLSPKKKPAPAKPATAKSNTRTSSRTGTKTAAKKASKPAPAKTPAAKPAAKTSKAKVAAKKA